LQELQAGIAERQARLAAIQAALVTKEAPPMGAPPGATLEAARALESEIEFLEGEAMESNPELSAAVRAIVPPGAVPSPGIQAAGAGPPAVRPRRDRPEPRGRLPARVQRGDAAAVDDRDGPRVQAAAPDRGRAHDGARRDHAGPDPRGDPGPPAGAERRDDHH